MMSNGDKIYPTTAQTAQKIRTRNKKAKPILGLNKSVMKLACKHINPAGPCSIKTVTFSEDVVHLESIETAAQYL